MRQDGYAQVDDAGRLVLSPDLAARYGLQPGVRVRVDEGANGFEVPRAAPQMAKLYIEPTNLCNLDCRICIRNVWDEPLGLMSDAVFARVVGGLRDFSPPPSVFFGGFGEPLFHPSIIEMVRQAKSIGAWVELISNGTRLTESLSRDLIAAGLDVLWVSIDGATPASYADVRLGAALPQVLENVRHFRDARIPAHRPTPEIGIAFVAMKRNVADLPAVLRLGRGVGASRFLVTNVLPYTDALRDEVLYHRALRDNFYLPSIWVPRVSLPKIDVNDTTGEPLHRVMRSIANVIWAGNNLGNANDRCPFVEGGAGAVSWDGSLSPCLPLLHSHTSYLNRRERRSRRWVLGNVITGALADLWYAPTHQAFRQRLQKWDFPPCTFCGCDLSEANEEDCFGNTFPTCGGCLWAQGVIQCP